MIESKVEIDLLRVVKDNIIYIYKFLKFEIEADKRGDDSFVERRLEMFRKYSNI